MAAHEVSSLVRQESLPSFPFDPFGVEAYPGTVSSSIVRMTDSRAGSTSSDGDVYDNWHMPRLDNYPGSVGSPLAGPAGGRSPLTVQTGGLLSPYRDSLPGSNLGPEANTEIFKQRLLDQHHHNIHLQRLRLRHQQQQQQIQDLQELQMRQANAELQQKIQEQQHLHDMQESGEVLKRSVAGGGPRTKDTAFAGLMAKIVPAAISSWLSRAITASVLKKVMPEGSPVAYPQRPGEKECAYYMRTGSCAYGVSCKYDHPSWLPPGGIPNWKEGQGVDGAAMFPERPGEIECAYYIKTGDCKYGGRCKYHHPRDRAGIGAAGSHVPEYSGTPRGNAFPMSPTAWAPGSPFDPDHEHHRLDDPFLSQATAAAFAAAVSSNSTPQHESHTKGAYGRPAPLNSKGLPIRLDEPDCAFYGKTGSCKYGAACKWNHPEGVVPTSPLLSSQHLSQGLNFGSNGSIDLQMLTSGLSASVPGSPLSLHVYPERPGVTECTFFMKTGTCKYGSNCKYHHPRSRFSSIGGGTSGVSSPRCATPVKSPMVKLTLAGLPRREDAEVCGYYMKTGACKYGSTCKYDHPPPGEAAAKAAAAARQKESGGSLSDSELTDVVQDGSDRWPSA